MKTPTSNAPHICLNVRVKISPICAPRRRFNAISSTTTMIHETRIAVPATNGVQLNTALTSGLAGSHAVVAIEEHATAFWLNQLTFGSVDHGPVHAATTTSNTMNGNHACPTSAEVNPCARFCCAAAGFNGTPP